MLGSAGPCLRAARGGQGTLQTTTMTMLLFPMFPLLLFPFWHQVLDGVPEGWCPALAVWWSGGVAGVAYRFQLKTDTFSSKIFFILCLKSILYSGRPRGGWGRFIAATGQGRFSFSRTASGLSWRVVKG